MKLALPTTANGMRTRADGGRRFCRRGRGRTLRRWPAGRVRVVGGLRVLAAGGLAGSAGGCVDEARTADAGERYAYAGRRRAPILPKGAWPYTPTMDCTHFGAVA